MFTDVLGWRRHKLVHGFTEKRDVAPSVVSYPRYQFSDRFLVLMDVFHVNGEHLLLAVCYALKLLHVFETFPASALLIILVITERHICKTVVPLLVCTHICG
jgi:hypothetical protein